MFYNNDIDRQLGTYYSHRVCMFGDRAFGSKLILVDTVCMCACDICLSYTLNYQWFTDTKSTAVRLISYKDITFITSGGVRISQKWDRYVVLGLGTIILWLRTCTHVHTRKQVYTWPVAPNFLLSSTQCLFPPTQLLLSSIQWVVCGPHSHVTLFR